nr:PIN domain-containing protein [uncultured Albidiferax sp.]
MGAALMAEYEDALGRTTLFQDCRLNAAERAELLDIFIAQTQWVRVYFGWRPNLRDEGDNHLIEVGRGGWCKPHHHPQYPGFRRYGPPLSWLAYLHTGRLFEGANTMSALTVRLSDDKHLRLRQLAKARATTINGLLNETVTLLLAEFDAEVHYRARALRGAGQQARGLALLAKAAGTGA